MPLDHTPAVLKANCYFFWLAVDPLKAYENMALFQRRF